MNKDIEKALANFRLQAGRYTKTEHYYDGKQDLAFATEKFQNTFGTLFREFALNLCPVICDAVRDKLRVTQFSIDDAGIARRSDTAKREDTQAGSLRSDAVRIWQQNRMGTRAGEIHKEALKNGDAYAIVWPDARGLAVIHPNKAANITVAYDEDLPGQISWAAKHWRTADKHIRLNLFYPDRIEKYISKNESEGSLPDAADFTTLGSKFKVQSSKVSSEFFDFEL